LMAGHPAIPPRVSWPWILGAAATWLIVALFGLPEVLPVRPGPYVGEIVMLTEPHEARYGSWALAAMDGTVVLTDVEAPAERGDTLEIRGSLRPADGVAAGRRYGGLLTIGDVTRRTPSVFLPHRVGSSIRHRVMDRLEPVDPGRGLLAGFLIGDTTGVSESDMLAMRRSGLAHFVAVSGSNVALFLGLLAVISGPLALGPRRRALVGLLGLPVYAAATRFEPSVMRASAMAALALAGRLAGVALEAWQLLALSVTGLILFDPGLVAGLGFQLSVAATAGVLVGARWPVRGRVGRALSVTMGAQLAVAPLLLWGFGSVPLLSPLINLAAAPLVSGATVLGALGAIGPRFLIGPAAWLAELVLGLARGASAWPQLGPWQVGCVLVAVLVGLAWRRIRPVAVVAAALMICLNILVPARALPDLSVAVLDVGQGDAILVNGGHGHLALVDGGPDATILLDALRAYGVDSLDIVVLTHVHADHASGLVGAIERLSIGELWAVPGPHSTTASVELFAAAASRGVSVFAPPVGYVRRLGALTLTVDGPVRRYAGPNDESIVITLTGPGRTMLLSGDIEGFAQTDLPGLHADVLKVPHHGSDTSDPGWLASVGAGLAVISVGVNDFGHPSDSTIQALVDAGAEVMRTDRDGDVVVDLRARASPFPAETGRGQ
jgi:competence protein ComEC